MYGSFVFIPWKDIYLYGMVSFSILFNYHIKKAKTSSIQFVYTYCRFFPNFPWINTFSHG